MVAKFAPICPISIVPEMQKHDIFGNYHLLLAHHVLGRPEEYSRAYKNHDYTIILDNSMIETGEALQPDLLMEACSIVGATYVVLPDVAHNSMETIVQSTIAVREWSKRAKAHTPQFMGVVQGRSYDEYWDCAKSLVERCGVSLLGVPKSAGKVLRTRHVLVGYLHDFGLPVHLLGFTDDLHDDFYCTSLPGVMGIDSAMPIWLGQKGEILPQYPVPHTSSYGQRPGDFFDNPNSVVNVCTLANVNIVRSWLIPFEDRVGAPRLQNSQPIDNFIRHTIERGPDLQGKGDYVRAFKGTQWGKSAITDAGSIPEPVIEDS